MLLPSNFANEQDCVDALARDIKKHFAQLPIIVGGMIALAVELLGISSLPFAIGLYLPLSLSTPLMAGGLMSMIVKKVSKKDDQKKNNEQGVLFGSGLVAGDALIGVAVAALIGSWAGYREFYENHDGMMVTLTGAFGPWLSLILFFGLAAVLGHLAYRGFKSKK